MQLQQFLTWNYRCVYSWEPEFLFWAKLLRLYAATAAAAAAAELLQSCLTLCDLVDCSLPGSSVNGIFQAKVLEWGVNTCVLSPKIQLFIHLGSYHCHLSYLFPSFATSISPTPAPKAAGRSDSAVSNFVLNVP